METAAIDLQDFAAPSTALAAALLREFMSPPPRLTVTEWAEQHRRLAGTESAEPGPYRVSRTPYAREPQDCMSARSTVEEVVLMWAAQTSKALALDTPIPTPGGWTTMGDIRVGDLVFGRDGRPVRVGVVSPVFTDHPCYRVTFSDGATVVCDAGHLWTVRIDRCNHGRPWTEIATLEAREIAGTLKNGRRHRYAVPVAKPLELPEVGLPIDPYVLGIWLGDGSAEGNSFTQSPADAAEIIEHIRAAGHETVVREQEDGNWRILIDPRAPGDHKRETCTRGHEMALVGRTTQGRCAECQRQFAMHSKYGRCVDPVLRPRDSLGLRLRDLGLRRNKHIPAAYLRAAHPQRLALLQGLMDTDGYADPRGRVSFCNSSPRLMSDAYDLAVSLGLKPVVHDRISRLNSKDFPTQIMSFTAYRETTPMFRLTRKLGRMLPRDGRRTSETEQRRIVDVESVPTVPTRCISVDAPDHLYLCGKAMVPTHNTTVMLNCLGSAVGTNPGPIMIVWPTNTVAKRNSRQRIAPLLSESPQLKAKVAANRSRDKANTTLLKEFDGGILVIAGANSAADLRSTPVRDLYLDEVDNFPFDVDGEGDPSKLAEARQTTFARKKRLRTSTPTTKGMSRIEAAYQGSDRCRYHVPCPHCGSFQPLEFGSDKPHGLKWDRNAAGEPLPATVRYVCAVHGCEIREHEKRVMLAAGVWVAENPLAAGGKVRGFHLNGLYSPLGWLSWRTMVVEWSDAMRAARAGDMSLLRVFVNTRLAETFEETGDKADEHELRRRAAQIPMGVVQPGHCVATLAVDVQPDRLHLGLWAWGRGMRRQLVERRVLHGDTNASAVWDELTEYRRTVLFHVSGREVPLLCTMVDSGGHNTQAVYAYARAHQTERVMAIKGQSQAGKPIIGKPKDVTVNFRGQKVARGVKLWPVGPDTAKAEFYGRLRVSEPGPGFVLLSKAMPDEAFEQLTAERLVTRYIRGRPKLEWVLPAGRRNEDLDCAVYALAGAHWAGMDRWREGDWLRWEKKVVPIEAASPAPGPQESAEPPAAPSPSPVPAEAPARDPGAAPAPSQQPAEPAKKSNRRIRGGFGSAGNPWSRG